MGPNSTGPADCLLRQATSCAGQQITLADLPVGCCARVLRLNSCDSCLRCKLQSMGVVAGVDIKVTRMAPLSDPIGIELLGYDLSLRKSEARSVLVETY